MIEMMKIFLSNDLFKNEILAPELPFDIQELQQEPKKLRLGYFSYDGIYYPTKTVRRAIDQTKNA